MSKIKLTGDTSGYVEISAPNVAANNTLELGGGTKILTNLDNVFTGVTTYSGNIDLNANLDLDDNNKILLGTGDDLQIYHNGSESIILDAGTGQLNIRTDLLRVNNTNDNETLATFANNGAVSLYYDNSKKLETTTTGATVTGTLVSGSVTSELDLTAISSSISDTAVDVFVYDTRKDSDGGAWRYETQHTSWYNETLGTSSRGSRKEFPAIAVIVAETTKITIYDGDDPDLPMWMIFTWSGTGNSALGYDNRAKSAVTMSNGQLVTCSNPDGVHIARFVYDDVVRYTHTGYFKTTSAIAERTGVPHVTINTTDVLVASTCNDVAMTVLPNAPIDDATGLPVPTIAVATDGGVSVIRDDGTVVDIRRTSDDDVHHVDFDGNRVIMFMELGAIYVATIPSVDQSGNPNSAWTVYGSYGGNTSGTDHPAVQAYGAGVDLVSMKDHTFATAGFNNSNDLYKGLSILSENLESSGNGMVAWAHTDFNTGWMHGDIKGAFLSDTDTTNVTASSAHYTETFTGSGDNTWGLAGGATMSGGVLTLANLNDSRATDLTAASSLTTGQKYIAEIEIASNTSQIFKLDDDGAGAGIGGNTNYGFCGSGQTGTFLIGFTKTASPRMRLIRVSGGPATITSFKIYTAEEQDRSLNNNGLKVFGTITKSAVATGADLVAYHGVNATNYIRQPYNSALNFGTGDFSIFVWVLKNNINTNHYIIDRSPASGSNTGRSYFIINSNGYHRFRLAGGNEVTGNVRAMTAGVYNHIGFVRKGGAMEFWMNGDLVQKVTGSNASASFDGGVTTQTMTISRFSANFDYDYTFDRMALLRISGSAPSAEQVKKMYEDEKVLFQENAKATLYGSSDAVTALGYDEDTELLHVGTSAGRSDFRGLRRINNTTTAVTTAISASDDLIAEQ